MWKKCDIKKNCGFDQFVLKLVRLFNWICTPLQLLFLCRLILKMATPTLTSTMTSLSTVTLTTDVVASPFQSREFVALYTCFLIAAVFVPTLLGLLVGVVELPMRKKRPKYDSYAAESKRANDASIEEDFDKIIQ